MPPEFDPSYKAPEWAWLVVLYFYVGGITAGIYFSAAWTDLFGDDRDRGVMRLGHLLAFPLILVSALFLILDLGQPLRFWHMLFQSARFPLPMLKPWSPMSAGSLILAAFGGAAFLSFVDATLGRGRLLHAPGNPLGKAVSVLGALGAFALAGYTGWLVNVTNVPVWASSPWLSALFLFSGLSTGVAAILLLARRAPHPTLAKLEETDTYLMALELLTLLVFLVTLGAVGVRFIVQSPAAILFAVVVVVGLLVPLGLQLLSGGAGRRRPPASLSAALVLIGGFFLRWAVLAGPQGVGLRGPGAP